MKFSVIIPAYNAHHLLKNCLISCYAQTISRNKFEVLLIDDCSTDELSAVNPGVIATTKDGENEMNITLFRTGTNSGPGAARNLGLDAAQGEWIVFLDADDKLTPDALERLEQVIEANPTMDVLGFDWAWADDHWVSQRKDGKMLELARSKLIEEYLQLHMDGSVIFTTIKRSVIEDYKLRFRPGFHEDVAFLFNIYCSATALGYLPEVLYWKGASTHSVTHTITEKHIDGFVQAWKDIGGIIHYSQFFDQLWPLWVMGAIGVTATRIREIFRNGGTQDQKNALLEYLRAALPDYWVAGCWASPLATQYAKVVKEFLECPTAVDRSLFYKTWSCTDLQGSLFLAPNEIRTCCKRFFFDNEMRGDVKLVDAKDATPEKILAAKQSLIQRINYGEETPCTGCPFMEFKEWPPIEPLAVTYLSMEHHSLCNMKCSYCDDTYYGGKQPEYNVEGLLSELAGQGSLEGLRTVVWGGGEPTIGKDFENLSTELQTTVPGVQQRILTNALKFSYATAKLLKEGKATIVTSVDAGTQETFTKVRGQGILVVVLKHLKEYASQRPEAVTIKYILTEDNSTASEIYAFRRNIENWGLTGCNFQISCNFKQEKATNDQAAVALYLYDTLVSNGCKVVFFDDLLFQRMPEMSPSKWPSVIATGSNCPRLTLFGTGAMTEWMIHNSRFLSNTKIVGKEEYIPGIPVLITGSQGYPETYYRALAMGVPEELIIRKLAL